MFAQLITDIQSGNLPESTALLALDAVQDRHSIYGKALFDLAVASLPMIIEKGSNRILAELLKVFNLQLQNEDTKPLVIDFTFKSFNDLCILLSQKIGQVTSVATPNDQGRLSCTEEVLKLLITAVDLDFAFLSSQGEQAFLEFVEFIYKTFTACFSLRAKLYCAQILASIFHQFFPESLEEDQQMKRLYERQLIGYTSLMPQWQPSPDAQKAMRLCLENASVSMSSVIKKVVNDNDPIFASVFDIILAAHVVLEETQWKNFRFRQKNEVRVLYSFVLETIKLVEQVKRQTKSKRDAQKQYVKIMNDHLDEKLLKEDEY